MAFIIFIFRTSLISFISLSVTGSSIDRGLPEITGVTRITCLILLLPLHVILRRFKVVSCFLTGCLGDESANIILKIKNYITDKIKCMKIKKSIKYLK